jgi:hypothetical protein
MSVNGLPYNLADWAKLQDPNGRTAKVVELLQQQNEILDDMYWMEGNLPTGHRTTVRTGLPAVTWRLLNGGVIPSKTTTAQLDEAAGMLEAYSEVDKDLAELNGDVGAFRASQASAFLESMNQTFSQTLFYGDTTINPERFLGLHPRFNTISGAVNGQNVMSAGGSGADNTSIWLICWGPNTVAGIFPKGSQAGIKHRDLGEVTVETTAGIAGGRMQAYREHWQWKGGLALRDWRYVVRMANIDVSDLGASTGTQNAQQLIGLLSRMIDRIPNLNMGKPVFYMSRTTASLLRVQAMNKSTNAIGVNEAIDQFGRTGSMNFMGIPIRRVDQILTTEATIS